MGRPKLKFLIFTLMLTPRLATADLVAAVDFTPGSETITFSGEDTGEMVRDGSAGATSSWYVLEWWRDLRRPEVTAGSAGDSENIVFEAESQTVSNTQLDFDFRALDKIEQFSLIETDEVSLRRRVIFAGMAPTVEITLRGNGTPLDISHWNSITLHNLFEVTMGTGVLPLEEGVGWEPIRFFASSSVPEPSGLIAMGFMGLLLVSRQKRPGQRRPE